MITRARIIDLGIAAALAVLLLIVAPGLGWVGIVSLAVVALAGLSFAVAAGRRRYERHATRPR